jgi:Rha family phage regulatory protein
MNDLTISKSTLKMTTLEIAERTGKEHRNVLRDTRKMLIELNGQSSLLKFEQSYIADNGRSYKCYALPKNEMLTLVSGYSTTLRMKIIQRWDELENGTPKFQTQNVNEILEAKLITAKHLTSTLKLSKTETLQLFYKINEDHGISTGYLTQCKQKCNRVARSLPYLYEKHDLGRSYDCFNVLMTQAGMMKKRKYVNLSWDKTANVCEYYVLVGDGLKYGLNKTFLNTPWTKPYYFDDTFLEIYDNLMDILFEEMCLPAINPGDEYDS